jgi:hypothetical protein
MCSPYLSFFFVTESEVYNAVMSIKSNAAGVDEIPLSFIKLLLSILLGRWLIFSIMYLRVRSIRPGVRPLWCYQFQILPVLRIFLITDL